VPGRTRPLAGEDFDIATIAHEPIFVPETMPALRLLDVFKESRTHISFVVDEYGSTQGLLTLNDLVAALVGDIRWRGDAPAPRATRRADGSWLLDGRLSLHEVVPLLGIPTTALAEISDVSTIAGVTLASLGHIPEEGETTDWRGWRLEVVDMDGARIDQILASRIASPRPDESKPD
jgi:putative hemolysin